MKKYLISYDISNYDDYNYYKYLFFKKLEALGDVQDSSIKSTLVLNSAFPKEHIEKVIFSVTNEILKKTGVRINYIFK